MRDLERKSVMYFLFKLIKTGCDVILGMGSSLSAGIGAGSGLI